MRLRSRRAVAIILVGFVALILAPTANAAVRPNGSDGGPRLPEVAAAVITPTVAVVSLPSTHEPTFALGFVGVLAATATVGLAALWCARRVSPFRLLDRAGLARRMRAPPLAFCSPV